MKNKRLNLLRLMALLGDMQAVTIFAQMRNAFGTELYIDGKTGAGSFFNTNHCAYFLTISILLVIGLFFYEKSKGRKFFWLLSLAIQYHALLLNNSFGSILAVWFGLLLAYVLLQLKGNNSHRSFLAAGVMIGVTFLNIAEYVRTFPRCSRTVGTWF